ncbi:hypothetical protein [uncultured Methanolobus sp.]|uniref:PspA-associated protein PspAA n=1 Tax=uncultured Methanolobus sp. TaxID=218300 RepID=UPI002AAC34BA|nr:hypothetical protein [uncultured Methanolobus sp.]
MIIRIVGEGQYEVPESFYDELNVIDNKIVDLVSGGNEGEYRSELTKLIESIKSCGKKVDDAEIVESDVIVPPEDLTFEEAKEVFKGEGIFED